MEKQRRRSIFNTIKRIDYSENAKKITEANAICIKIGTNLKFKQCFVKTMVDKQTGRKLSVIGNNPDADSQMKEEL